MRASQSAANYGHFTKLDHKVGRLLAWIEDQVRLKALLPNKRAFIQREAQPCARPGTIASP
jgi:hypothetical protein